ncbi:hypothetical protein SB773_34435, partial [Bacillus sp. SIMBA_074]
AASIDSAQQGSIIIHKFANPGNGTQKPDGSGGNPSTDAISGVVFEYCHIDNIDLLSGDNSGWNAVNAITAGEKQASAA